MSIELQEKIKLFKEEYLDTAAGQKHLARSEAEPKEVKTIFEKIRNKHSSGGDITEDVLKRLLPHSDTEFHRNNDYRISTWPCITKDICLWFEGAGWKKPEDWNPTARLIFEAVDGIINNDEKAWLEFLNSQYRHGFGTGFISPILYCLDERFPVINSKVIKTYKYCNTELGEPDEIDAKLSNYLKNAEKVMNLQKQLEPFNVRDLKEFDIFCHYCVSKRLGGKRPEIKYEAWLFVANPEIFKWEQAFQENGVDWTQSLGGHAQKMLRKSIRAGDRVFGYQAGPHYEICCELKVTSDPYKTSEGKWAARLQPIRVLENPIPLSFLKNDPVLSNLKFVQQAQLSISGITEAQLTILDKIIKKPIPITKLGTTKQICKDLLTVQFETKQPDKYEKLLADAFNMLGFEAEHLGGPGKPDIFITGRLGSDSYSAVIDAKTCKEDSVISIAQVNYNSIIDFQEEYTADYAVLIGSKFSGGKLIQHAKKNKVGIITTETIVSLLELHEQFPFSIIELKHLFEVQGLAEGIKDELARINAENYNYIRLVSTVLEIFDELQRQQDISEPITSNGLNLWLLGQAQHEGLAVPDRKQIDQVLSFLSSPIIGILDAKEDGFILALSPEAARKRLEALASLFLIDDE